MSFNTVRFHLLLHSFSRWGKEKKNKKKITSSLDNNINYGLTIHWTNMHNSRTLKLERVIGMQSLLMLLLTPVLDLVPLLSRSGPLCATKPLWADKISSIGNRVAFELILHQICFSLGSLPCKMGWISDPSSMNKMRHFFRRLVIMT